MDESLSSDNSADTSAERGLPRELDVIDLFLVLWRRKYLILTTIFVFGVLGFSYSLVVKPTYRVEVVLALSQGERGPALPSQLSGLASLAGVNLSAPGDRNQVVAILRSRLLIEDFITDEGLMPILFEEEWDAENERWKSMDPEEWPEVGDGIEFFVKRVRSVNEDPETRLITLVVEWSDPEIAAQWASKLVNRVNATVRRRDLTESAIRLEYLSEQLESATLIELRQAIARLIEEQMQTMMLAQADKEYAFRVIDPPRVPHERSGPRTLVIVAISLVLGGALAVLLALIQHAIAVSKMREQPDERRLRKMAVVS